MTTTEPKLPVVSPAAGVIVAAAEVYPLPAFVTRISLIVPFEFKTTSAVAPVPSPIIVIDGVC